MCAFVRTDSSSPFQHCSLHGHKKMYLVRRFWLRNLTLLLSPFIKLPFYIYNNANLLIKITCVNWNVGFLIFLYKNGIQYSKITDITSITIVTTYFILSSELRASVEYRSTKRQYRMMMSRFLKNMEGQIFSLKCENTCGRMWYVSYLGTHTHTHIYMLFLSVISWV